MHGVLILHKGDEEYASGGNICSRSHKYSAVFGSTPRRQTGSRTRPNSLAMIHYSVVKVYLHILDTRVVYLVDVIHLV